MRFKLVEDWDIQLNESVECFNSGNSTNLKTFDISDSKEIGIHCGTKECAEEVAKRKGYKHMCKLTFDDSKCLPVSEDLTSIWSSMEIIRVLRKSFNSDELTALQNQMRQYADSANKTIMYSTLIREFILNHGYNVISYTNEIEDKGSTSYIILDTSVIKNVEEVV